MVGDGVRGSVRAHLRLIAGATQHRINCVRRSHSMRLAVLRNPGHFLQRHNRAKESATLLAAYGSRVRDVVLRASPLDLFRGFSAAGSAQPFCG